MTAGVKYSKLERGTDRDSKSKTQEISAHQRRKNCLKTMLKSAVVFTLLAVLLAVCSSIFVDGFSFVKLDYPLHASCKVDWTFDMACADVSKALVDQMTKWEGPENCQQGGEKCLYKVKSSNSTRIEGTHTTPVKSYVDDLTFDLTKASSGCSVHGFSTSETWYAYLDSGTNYCNLHNLITGSGLDQSPGYTEKTSDDVCTQYSSADCSKY